MLETKRFSAMVLAHVAVAILCCEAFAAALEGPRVDVRLVEGAMRPPRHSPPPPPRNSAKFPVPERSPALLSGPLPLLELYGRCFAMEDEDSTYEYKLCPFANVTQREISKRHGAFHGILGLWSHWNVGQNTTMVFTDGTECSEGLRRRTTVKLQCGSSNQILDVSEPETCNYDLIFSTPLACNNLREERFIHNALEPPPVNELDRRCLAYKTGHACLPAYSLEGVLCETEIEESSGEPSASSGSPVDYVAQAAKVLGVDVSVLVDAAAAASGAKTGDGPKTEPASACIATQIDDGGAFDTGGATCVASSECNFPKGECLGYVGKMTCQCSDGFCGERCEHGGVECLGLEDIGSSELGKGVMLHMMRNVLRETYGVRADVRELNAVLESSSVP